LAQALYAYWNVASGRQRTQTHVSVAA